jgi:hypothetical protein
MLKKSWQEKFFYIPLSFSTEPIMFKPVFLTLMLISALFGSEFTAANCASCKPKPPTPAPTPIPAAYACLERNGPFVIASFLYWGNQMSEGVVTSEYTAVGTNGIAYNLKDYSIPAHYNPGFKVGVGATLKEGMWSPMVLWTYMHSNPNKTWDSTTHSLITDLTSPVLNNYQFTLDGETLIGANNVQASWTLNFNSIDVEMGRTFIVGEDFIVRPFGCVKLGSVLNKLDVTYSNLLNLNSAATWPNQTVVKKNQAWLVGPRVGVNNYFRFVKDFGIIASVATSLLAVIDNPKVYTHVTGPAGLAGASLGNSETKSETNIQPEFDLFIGLDWGHCFKKATFFSIAVGYEMQWYASVINASQSLNMYGLTVDLLFDF